MIDYIKIDSSTYSRENGSKFITTDNTSQLKEINDVLSFIAISHYNKTMIMEEGTTRPSDITLGFSDSWEYNIALEENKIIFESLVNKNTNDLLYMYLYDEDPKKNLSNFSKRQHDLTKIVKREIELRNNFQLLRDLTFNLRYNEKFIEFLNHCIPAFGFENTYVELGANFYKLCDNNDKTYFNPDSFGSGFCKLLDILNIIFLSETLGNKGIFIYEDFDAGLHPLLAKALYKEINNITNISIITTTHYNYDSI